MLPHANDLSYFVEICHAGSLIRASERLGITQPALSAAIKRLEDNCGAKLLLREHSGVRPTRAGLQLLTGARQLLEDWQRVHAEIRREDEAPSGTYRIGCHPSVGLYTLPNLLPRMLAEAPNLSISLVHGLSRHIVEGIVSHRVDFGIVVNPVRQLDLVIEILDTDEVTLWRKSGIVSANSTATSNTADVLIYDPDLLQARAILDEMRKQGVRVGRTVASSSLEIVAALTAAGCGVGVLPTRVARCFAERSVEKLPGAPVYHDEIALVYRQEQRTTKAGKFLIAMLRESLQSMGPSTWGAIQ